MAIKSSNLSGFNCFKWARIPSDENWKIPFVVPFLNTSYVCSSSSGILSISIKLPCSFSIIFIQSLIIVKFLNPKKSIFNKPASSTTLLSNCVTIKSESFEFVIGIRSINGSGVIITPQACVPTFLMEPSSFIALLMVSAGKSFPLDNSISFIALGYWSFFTLFFSSFSERLKILDNEVKSGTNLAILSASKRGKSKTRAVSLIDDLAAIVP